MIFREAGQLCAVLPCFVLEWEGRQQLTLIGTGITDYLDPLIMPGCEERVVDLLGQHLAEQRGWEIIDWTDLSPDHPLFGLPGALKQDWMPRCELQLGGVFEECWAKRGKDLRRNVRRYREKAEQLGRVSFEISDTADSELITALVSLHSRRWQAQGLPGMIEANHSAGFLGDIAREMSAMGMARFFTLHLDCEVTAIIFALTYRKRIHAYMSAFEPQYAHLSMGQTLLYEAIRASFSEWAVWDFLRGGEPYKLHFGGQLFPRAKLRLERPPAA